MRKKRRGRGEEERIFGRLTWTATVSQEYNYGGFVPRQRELLMCRGRIAYFGQWRDLFCGRGLEGLELLVEVIL